MYYRNKSVIFWHNNIFDSAKYLTLRIAPKIDFELNSESDIYNISSACYVCVFCYFVLIPRDDLCKYFKLLDPLAKAIFQPLAFLDDSISVVSYVPSWSLILPILYNQTEISLFLTRLKIKLPCKWKARLLNNCPFSVTQFHSDVIWFVPYRTWWCDNER
jgi:hypothetical protein